MFIQDLGSAVCMDGKSCQPLEIRDVVVKVNIY